jgi:hypothetical protein
MTGYTGRSALSDLPLWPFKHGPQKKKKKRQKQIP